MQLDKSYQDYLKLLFKDICGFDDEAARDTRGNRKLRVYTTYGELLYTGFKKLINQINITEEDIFYDFGSGVGKLCFMFFMHTNVKKSIGIEAHKPRAKQAKQALKVFKKDLPEFFENKRQLKFYAKNFLDVDITGATIVYACSTCFPELLLKQLGRIFNSTKSIKTVISLKPIENLKLPLSKQIKIQTGWDKAENCYIYGEIKK